MRQPIRALVVATAAALVAAPAHGQAGHAAPGVESYRFADDAAVGIRSITLFTVPLGLDAPLAGPVSLALRGAFAHAGLERTDGPSVTLSGLTDTDLRVTVRLLQDRVSVSGIAALPTGSATHTADEAIIAGLVAADLLPFRISHWGAGGGAGLGASYHAEFGATAMQAGASYLVTREFEPLADDRFGYRPGNQVAASLDLQHQVGGAGHFRLRTVLQLFDDDVVDGDRLYSPGNRLQAIGSYAFMIGDVNAAVLYAGGMHRAGGNALHPLATDAPDQTLFLGGGGLRVPMGGMALLPSADIRAYRAADGIGQGWVGAAGLAAEFDAGPLTLTPAALGRYGNVVIREGQESGITGFSLTLTARFNAGLR